MRKILFLFLLILSGCVSSTASKTTGWNTALSQNVPGIVLIGTGWGKAPLCSGVLITKKHIITAAHCIKYPKKDLFIIYNCNNIQDKECIKVSTKKVSIYPNWKKDFHASHDLAIMESKTNISLIPVKLASEPLETGMPLWVAGFGRRNNSAGILYEGLGRLSKDYKYEFVIAMNSRLDPNPGDSGGPAYVWENEQFKLFGILSRSHWSRSRLLTPRKSQTFYHAGFATYTKPQAYLEWIYKVTSE